MSERCEYRGGCSIEPLVAMQATLIQERDRLYVSVRETNDSQLVNSLIAQAQNIQSQNDRIEARKNGLHPCKYCIYQ